jgi:predicted Zn-dependent protease
MFRKKILFTHLNQLPIAFIDVILLKQKDVMQFATPSYSKLLVICFTYTFTYLAFTHLNHRVNGGVYPYTFMDKVFQTWKSEISFFIGLSCFCFLVSSLFHFVASDELDRLLSPCIKL